MCTRCVRFTREVSGTSELAVFGRGHKEEIDVFPGRPVNNPLAGNVVDICPVGALLDKDFLFTQRVWFLKSTPSISPISAGGENIEIHHNEGRIYRIKPRFNKDVNKWWISDETRYGFEFVHDAARLRNPEQLNRAGTGTAERSEISWEAAYQIADQKLRAAVAEGGQGSLACVVSPFDSTEEIFLQVKYARSIDPQAWLVMNPVRIEGQDQVFRNPTSGQTTFILRAEKAPNRRGVEKIIAHFGGNTCALADLANKKLAAAIAASDPFRPQDLQQRVRAFANIPAIIRLGMTPVGMYEHAAINLPTCSWAEKSGVYENVDGRIQPFQQAIAPLDDTRSTGQICHDLLRQHGRYTAQGTRSAMAAAGLGDYAHIAEPTGTVHVEEMEFAAL
jgi:NADH-quinone oxidoreductase subunit G